MSRSVEFPVGNGILPKKHNDVYEAVSPTRLAGTMRGKVVFITGAGKVTWK